MATSRTGTTKYLRNRKRVLDKARRDGMTHCPGWTSRDGTQHPCGRELDWDTPGLPNSAEVDHIVPYRYGGTDDIGNLSVLCRQQNLEKGDGSRVPAGFASADEFPLSRDW